MERVSTNFRSNICGARKTYGLTQKQMAAILGISVSKLRRLEAGDPSVRLNDIMLCRFCDHFHLTADSAILEQIW